MTVDDEQSVLGYLLLVKVAQELRSEVGETFNSITRYIYRLVSHCSSGGTQYKHTIRNIHLSAMHEH